MTFSITVRTSVTNGQPLFIRMHICGSLSFDSITQRLVCVPMPVTQNVWGRFLCLWTGLDALSAVEIVLFISQQYCAALYSFIFSVFKDVYALLGDSGYI